MWYMQEGGAKVLKKMFSVSAVCLFACLVFVLTLNTSLVADQVDSPDMVTIKSKLWQKPKYGPSEFTHNKHVQEYKIQCAECHHVYKGGKNVWKEGDKVDKCDVCHTCVKTGKALKEALVGHGGDVDRVRLDQSAVQDGVQESQDIVVDLLGIPRSRQD